MVEAIQKLNEPSRVIGDEEAPGIDISEKKRTFITKGEHIHKWSTYIILDWVANTAVGVSFSYWGKFSEMGKKVWSQPITKFFEGALKPFIKDSAKRAKSAEYGNIFASIISGGMFILPPLMVLENNKVRKSITQFFDRMIYGKDKVDHDPKFLQAYAEMDEKPKKGFWIGMLARGAALAPELAIVLIPTTKEIANKAVFNHIENASGFLAKKAGFSAASFKNVSAAEGEKRWKFIHENISMDFGLGGPYALLHAVFYNMFAAIAGHKRDDKKPNAVQRVKTKTGAPETKPAETHAVEAAPTAEAVIMEPSELAKFTGAATKKAKPEPRMNYAEFEAGRKADIQQPAMG